MADEPPKRSRFDIEEPSKPKTSTIERSRSRSPATKAVDESRRSRSPDAKPKAPVRINAEEAKAKALAIAARLTASLAARKGIQHAAAPPVSKAPVETTEKPKDDVHEETGTFKQEIDINDVKVKYILTKEDWQKKVGAETGTEITTTGSWYPNAHVVPAGKQTLHLCVTATTRAALEMAVAIIEEEKAKDALPNLIDERRTNRRREPEVERDALGRRKWPEADIAIDLEPIPGFNLRATVVGAGGANVKHIQHETGCRVQIKGQGSGFLEPDTNDESDKAMYLYVTAPQPEQVQAAKEIAEDLIKTVKQQYLDFKEGRSTGEANYSGNQESAYRGGQEPYRGGRGGREYRRGGGRGGGYEQGWSRGGSHYNNADVPSGQYASSPLDYDRVGVAEAGRDNGNVSGRGTFGAETGFGVGYPIATHLPAAHESAPPPPPPAAQQQQAGYSTSSVEAAAAAANMDVTTYQAWVAYYSANPQADQYAAQGGFAYYMQSLAAYNQQYAGTTYSGADTATAQAYSQGYSSTSSQDYSHGYAGQGYGSYSTGYGASGQQYTAGSPAQGYSTAGPAQHYIVATPTQAYTDASPAAGGPAREYGYTRSPKPEPHYPDS